jgi:hypothetical protein
MSLIKTQVCYICLFLISSLFLVMLYSSIRASRGLEGHTRLRRNIQDSVRLLDILLEWSIPTNARRPVRHRIPSQACQIL